MNGEARYVDPDSATTLGGNDVYPHSWGQVLFFACPPSSEGRLPRIGVASCMLHGVVPSAGSVLKSPLLGPIPNDAITPTPPSNPWRKNRPTRARDGEDPMARPGRAGAVENDAMVTPGRFSALRPLAPAAGGKSRLFGPIRPPSRPLLPPRCIPYAYPGRRVPGRIFAIIQAHAHPSRGAHRRWAAGRDGPPRDPGGRLAGAGIIL